MRSCWPVWAACTITALAACQAPPRVIATGPFPVAGAAQRRFDGPSRPQDAVWSFTVTGAACEAKASGPSIGLALRVAGDRSLHMTLSSSPRALLALRGGAAATIAFAGPEGAWTLTGRRGGGRAVSVSLPLDETSVSHARTVLGGGQVKLAGGETPPLLTIPDAGVAGRDWFGCIRSRLAG